MLGAAQVELSRADALEFLRCDTGEYDVIFVDPPFGAGYESALLASLPSRLAADGRVYYESGARAQWPAGWEVEKEGRAGQVVFQLLKRT